MTHADITDVRGLSLSAASSAAVERFDALIDDIYYYRLGVQDRLDALLQDFPEFVLAHGRIRGRCFLGRISLSRPQFPRIPK